MWCGLAPVLVLVALASCVPATQTAEQSRDLAIDYKDPVIRQIASLQDRMLVDSLLPFLGSSVAEQRYLAARAFGSLRADSLPLALVGLLKDPILEVRTMAAYALGQQGKASAVAPLMSAFEPYDTAGFFAPFHRAVLEAAGKVGDTATLRALAGISTYRPQDTLLLLGQMQGIYRLSNRGIVSRQGTVVMLGAALDPTYPADARLYAAHYAGRAKVTLDSFAPQLLAAVRAEVTRPPSDSTGGDLAIALARALGNTTDTTVALALPRLIAQARDVRVKVELLRAARKHPHPVVLYFLKAAVVDTSEWVARTAAETLVEIGIPSEATAYWSLARDSVVRSVKPAMYAAALRSLPPLYGEYRQYINGELRRQLAIPSAGPADYYYKADLLRTMAEWPWNFRYLIEQVFGSGSRAERTAAAEALDAIAERPDIVEYMRTSFPAFKREYAEYFRRVFAGDDASLQAVAAGTIAIPNLYFKTEFPELGFLAKAAERLTLPQHVETLYAIEDARAVLEPGFTPTKAVPTYNHAVNWDIFRSLQPGLMVAISTPRGEIVVDLFEQRAPATTVNFVQLVRTGFYNGKVFHRVVPDFVTQGGDPSGDGYGSLDFTIRSETPPIYYDEGGYVGMASAGPHTEGVQFFFTHTATPHLDGRYTIFGKVVEGMDVVLALRRGDAMRMQLR